MQQIGIEQLNALPYSHIALWTHLEVGLSQLGLYIFGKNLNLLSMFIGTKIVGNFFHTTMGSCTNKMDVYKMVEV
jgi:hypothetical protein